MTQNHTLIRKSSVLQGDTDALDDFLVVDEWDGIMWFSDSTGSSLDSVFVNLGFHACDCGTTDVSDQPLRTSLDVYPNPASGDVVWVKASSAIREVTVHNLAGQRVSRQAVLGSVVVEVPLETAPAGVYLMEVVLENGERMTRRVIRK